MWLLAALACESPVARPAHGAVPPMERAARASLALRGIRPSLAELEAVRDEPDLLPFLVDRWLEDPRFGVTVRRWTDETWLLSSGVASVPINGPLAGYDPVRIRASLADALPRLVEYTVVRDHPYTEIVTTPFTLADDVVAAAWQGIGRYDPQGDTWQVTTWTDGRPAAGILSDSYLYVAYRSAATNYNRGRANEISRALLCRDFLASDPIPDTSIDLADPAVVADAVRADPRCAACHEDLDPLGSFLAMRAYPVMLTETWPLAMYSPAYQSLWQDTTGRAPAYFGQPGDDIGDLGRSIAADPAFASCAARRLTGYLEQTPIELVDDARVAELTADFVAGGYRLKALARDIVLSDAFADPDRGRVARPDQLGALFADLTGFTWSLDSGLSCCEAHTGVAPYGSVPDLTDDAYVGWRVLLGGVDAPHVALPSHTVNPTYQVVLRSYAQVAAADVVAHDLAGDAPPRLLDRVDNATTDEGAVRAQLSDLHARLYAEDAPPDGEEVDHTYALWEAAREAHGGEVSEAWRVTLVAMLQDARLVTY